MRIKNTYKMFRWQLVLNCLTNTWSSSFCVSFCLLFYLWFRWSLMFVWVYKSSRWLYLIFYQLGDVTHDSVALLPSCLSRPVWNWTVSGTRWGSKGPPNVTISHDRAYRRPPIGLRQYISLVRPVFSGSSFGRADVQCYALRFRYNPRDEIALLRARCEPT
jgi:hypothetical protein